MYWIVGFVFTLVLCAFLGPLGAVIAVGMWAYMFATNKVKFKK